MTQPMALDYSRFANAIDFTTLKNDDLGGVSNFAVDREMSMRHAMQAVM
jgi:hypothetical protein